MLKKIGIDQQIRSVGSHTQTRILASLRGVQWFRSVVVFEAVTLFVLSVGLTIAPEFVLGSAAAATGRAWTFAQSYRPVVSFFGLLSVGVTLFLLRALLKKSKSLEGDVRREEA